MSAAPTSTARTWSGSRRPPTPRRSAGASPTSRKPAGCAPGTTRPPPSRRPSPPSAFAPLGAPADREVGERLQGFAPLAGRERRQRSLGVVGVVGGQAQGGVERAGPDHQFARAAEVGVGLLVAADRPLPELGFAHAGAGDGEDQRQRRLALAEIVAGVLAERL